MPNWEWITYFALGLLLWLAGKFYYKKALQYKILDNPSERSSHQIPTVRGGGIIIFIAVVIWLVYETVFSGNKDMILFSLAFILLSTTGFIDDRHTLSPKIRFPFQLIAVLLILYAAGLFRADFHWSIKILAVVVSLGFVNAYNFMDGINGITGFYSIVLVLVYWYLNNTIHLFPETLFPVLLVSLTAFGYFNFRKKALMFAGDIGSMALAAVFLFITARYMIHLKSPVLLLTVLVYGVDSAMTIIIRMLKKQNIFQAHRWHIYQKLTDDFRLSHLSVSSIYAFVQLAIGIIVIKARWWTYGISRQMFILGMFLGIFVIIYLLVQKNKLRADSR
jgi:UDP-N-acetylmuramyl pentapeptide phosphotransferase/UDP-N-acetylglucosamine-1-phosphate transferase